MKVLVAHSRMSIIGVIERAAIRSITAALNESVEVYLAQESAMFLFRHVASEELGSVLAKAKVYVHCARGEHFDIAIVEVVAAVCLPVVHASGGSRESVTEEVCYELWG